MAHLGACPNNSVRCHMLWPSWRRLQQVVFVTCNFGILGHAPSVVPRGIDKGLRQAGFSARERCELYRQVRISEGSYCTLSARMRTDACQLEQNGTGAWSRRSQREDP